MKTLLIALYVFAHCCVSAQENKLVKKNFITGADMTVQSYNYIKKKMDTGHVIFRSNWKFQVVDITDSNFIILKQWDTKKKSADNNFNNKNNNLKYFKNSDTYADSNNDGQFLAVSLKDFESKCDAYFTRGYDFTFGVMTIPIKLRSGNSENSRYFEFDEKFNIGLSAGVKHSFNSRKDRSLSLLLNTSISNVRIDSLNTAGFQKTSQSTSAFTLATGLLFKQESFNIGFFLGWDKVSGVLGKNWKFQGKPWFGVGIGFSLFSVDLGSAETGKNSGK